jgi:histone arginine demethylase JMJD6
LPLPVSPPPPPPPPDLDEDEWNKYGYYRHPIGVGEDSGPHDFILRIHERDTSRRHFQETFEATRTPVIIDGICQRWPAWSEWSFEKLERRYGDTRMKCGEDDDGRSIRVRMWKYLEYMRHQTDDSPVYLFEGAFDEDRKCRRLLEE